MGNLPDRKLRGLYTDSETGVNITIYMEFCKPTLTRHHPEPKVRDLLRRGVPGTHVFGVLVWSAAAERLPKHPALERQGRAAA